MGRKNATSVQFSLHAKLTFNISVVGQKSAGKSSLIIREVKQNFEKSPKESQGFEFYSKNFQRKGDDISFQIWDTTGKNEYKSMTRNFFRQSAAIILVYDEIQGLEKQIDALMKQLNEYAHDSVKFCIVRTKIDVKPLCEEQKQIIKQIGQKKFPGIIFHSGEVSSKSNINVHQYFSSLVDKMHNCYEQDEDFRQAINPKKDSFALGSISQEPKDQLKKKKNCCFST